MTEDEERKLHEALQAVHQDIQRIEAEYLAHRAAQSRKLRRFWSAWTLGIALMLLNRYTINDPTINYLFQLACLAWVIQSVVDLWRLTRKKRP